MIRRQICPICNRELPAGGLLTFPFCSQRCRHIDFYRWCEGRYAIVEELDPDAAQVLAEDLPADNGHEDLSEQE